MKFLSLLLLVWTTIKLHLFYRKVFHSSCYTWKMKYNLPKILQVTFPVGAWRDAKIKPETAKHWTQTVWIWGDAAQTIQEAVRPIPVIDMTALHQQWAKEWERDLQTWRELPENQAALRAEADYERQCIERLLARKQGNYDK